MLGYVALGQDQVARRGPGTHHLNGGLAGCTFMGATGGLAIDGNLLAGQDFVDGLHPTEKTRLKLLGLEPCKDAPKRVMRGNAVG